MQGSAIVFGMIRRWGIFALVLVLLSGAFAKDKGKFQQPKAVHLDRDGEKWAEKTLKRMSLEEKIGQMIMVWSKGQFLNVNSPEYASLRDTMKKYHLGGFGFTVPVQLGLLMKTEPYEAAAMINQLQYDSKYPLIFAADFERGLSMRLNGVTVFPHAMAFGATGKPEYAEDFGRITAQEARAIGIEWNWFPDADVNSNPQNPIINTRSFGEDPAQVSEFVTAYIKGAHKGGMLATAKHFPGHGDTATDSHLGLASVNVDRAHLETIELPPFRAAIKAGVDAVMVAHITVPQLDNGPDRVGTNSPVIVTGLLKKELGFKGLVVTDGLEMNGLMRLYSRNPGVNPSAAAAVATVKAGNDMVIIPADVDGAYNGLLEAVKSGEIPEKQVDESVRKILRAKASVGLNKERMVDLNAINRMVGDPKNVAKAQEIADSAVTLVRDNGKVMPLKYALKAGTGQAVSPYTQVQQISGRVLALVLTDDLRSEYGREFERQLRMRVPDAEVVYIDRRPATLATIDVASKVAGAQAVIVAVYSAPSAGKALNDPMAVVTEVLQKAREKTIVVGMGNPYFVQAIPGVENYVCTFSNTTVSEVSAVKALFGEISVRGRLPISIPALAQRGYGMERPALTVQGGVTNHASQSNNAANP